MSNPGTTNLVPTQTWWLLKIYLVPLKTWWQLKIYLVPLKTWWLLKSSIMFCSCTICLICPTCDNPLMNLLMILHMFY